MMQHIIRCPFCGKRHLVVPHWNILCSCNSKFYIHSGQWLNRTTGEIVDLYKWKE